MQYEENAPTSLSQPTRSVPSRPYVQTSRMDGLSQLSENLADRESQSQLSQRSYPSASPRSPDFRQRFAARNQAGVNHSRVVGNGPREWAKPLMTPADPYPLSQPSLPQSQHPLMVTRRPLQTPSITIDSIATSYVGFVPSLCVPRFTISVWTGLG